MSGWKLSTSESSVIISEVELNPPGNDRYTNIYEWVERYNPTDEDINLIGWTLSTTGSRTVTVNLSGVIKAHGYFVIERGEQWLDNKDESVHKTKR